MNITKVFFRFVISLICVLFFVVFARENFAFSTGELNAISGAIIGLAFSLLLFFSDRIFLHVNLKTLNTVTLGLFLGYLLGQALLFIFSGLTEIATLALPPATISFIRGLIFLVSIYLGTMITLHSAEEFYLSVPFVKLKPKTHKKRDILIDISALKDPRIIDLAASGIVDNQLVLPRFVLNEIYETVESKNENEQSKARRSLEIIKKLESLPTLELRYSETDFPKMEDARSRIIRLARMIDANVLSADISLIEQTSSEGVRIINMHSLAKALKPLTQTGETINIKVQRYGKETRQGVGYLDDGTMVVINGGAEYIGEIIKAQVLSVKHTSSGRMIFCNALEGNQNSAEQDINMESPLKTYYPV